jgi:hypothetical protein
MERHGGDEWKHRAGRWIVPRDPDDLSANQELIGCDREAEEQRDWIAELELPATVKQDPPGADVSGYARSAPVRPAAHLESDDEGVARKRPYSGHGRWIPVSAHERKLRGRSRRGCAGLQAAREHGEERRAARAGLALVQVDDV